MYQVTLLMQSIIQSDKDVQMKGGLEVENSLSVNGGITVTDRAGTATKSAFFDTSGKLVEGNIV